MMVRDPIRIDPFSTPTPLMAAITILGIYEAETSEGRNYRAVNLIYLDPKKPFRSAHTCPDMASRQDGGKVETLDEWIYNGYKSSFLPKQESFLLNQLIGVFAVHEHKTLKDCVELAKTHLNITPEWFDYAIEIGLNYTDTQPQQQYNQALFDRITQLEAENQQLKKKIQYLEAQTLAMPDGYNTPLLDALKAVIKQHWLGVDLEANSPNQEHIVSWIKDWWTEKYPNEKKIGQTQAEYIDRIVRHQSKKTRQNNKK